MSEGGSELIRADGQLEAFGFPSAPARLVLIARPASWRVTRVLLSLLVGWGIIPVVFFVPPHFPWAIAAFGGGIYFARRFSRERHTLVSLDSVCPRCGTAVRETKRGPLKDPHTLHCSSCGQELLLRVDACLLSPDSHPRTARIRR